jgi:hypothetical protein
MPTLKPDLKGDRAAVEALSWFVDEWIKQDAPRALALRGAKAVGAALQASVKDMRTSISWANEVELDEQQARAFVYFCRLFLKTARRKFEVHSSALSPSGSSI